VERPAKAGLEDAPPDGQAADPKHRDGAVRELPELVGLAESPPADLAHPATMRLGTGEVKRAVRDRGASGTTSSINGVNGYLPGPYHGQQQRYRREGVVAVARSMPKAPPKPEESWQVARLIPTTGIGGQDEQEQRATSSLLAVMQAVPQFGRAILKHAGAPAGRIRSFTEIRFLDEDAKLSIPDGAVVVEWGRSRWVCLVEVKTSGVELRVDQVNRYLELARANNFDAVLTISNQITASPTESPLAVDPRKLKKVTLRHLSWWQVMTEARVEREHRGISDPDQAWILGELIAYLDHQKAGAGGFEDMGEKWVAVRDGARQGSLRSTDAGVRDVVRRWEQFVQYVALGLCQQLGRNVSPVWPRGLDAGARVDAGVKSLVETGRLTATLRVPDAAAPIDLVADLRTRYFTTSVELSAPREGRPKTRIGWMLRQLKGAPESLRIETRYPNAKESPSETLKVVLEKPDRLLYAPDLKREPRLFRLSLSRELGSKRGKGLGSFVHDSRQQTLDFYQAIVQQLRVWNAPAPKLPERAEPPSAEASSTPPPFGAEREFGDATEPEG
jgi:hypothetical protein